RAQIGPKALRASAVEALTEFDKSQKFNQPLASDASAFMSEADSGRVSQKKITPRFTLLTKENTRGVVFETKDGGRGNATLHRAVRTWESATGLHGLHGWGAMWSLKALLVLSVQSTAVIHTFTYF